MPRNQLTLIAVGFAAGLVAAVLYFKITTKPPLGESAFQMAAPTAVTADVAAVPADYERKLADLRTQLDAAKASVANATSVSPPAGLKPSEIIKRVENRLEADRAVARDQDTAKLLAAGYSQERIDFIRKRAAELAADFRRNADLLRQQTGKIDFGAEQAHDIDPDIDLRRELGDEEYTRYRQVLGRSIGMKISEVTPGGTGESAGLKVGDEIVSYNGVRVFNNGDLSSVMSQHMNAGTSVPVDVIRNGQKLRVNVPVGRMYVRSGSMLPSIPGR